MRTKAIKYGLILLLVSGISGCATMQSLGIASKPAKTVRLTNPDPVSITIPEGRGINGGTCASFAGQAPSVWGVIAYHGKIVKRQLIQIKELSDSSFLVERRTDNGITGSGVLYKVDYSIERKSNSTILKIAPVQYQTYQEGLTPFDVPRFTEKEVIDFIIQHVGGYKSA